MIVKFCLTASLCTLFIQAGEVYPNSIKMYGYGVNVMTSKLGALVFTFVLELIPPSLVNLVFGLLCGVNLVACFFVVETLGRAIEAEIPELVQEKSNLDVIEEADEENHIN